MKPTTNCPNCKQTSLSMLDEAPEPDAQTLCGFCGSVLIFNADLTLRKMTEAEIAKLPRIQRELLREAMRLAKDHR